MSAVADYLHQNRDRLLSELQELLRIPSISTLPERAGDVRRAAEWLGNRLRSAGCTTVSVEETGGHPIVYGEWLGVPGKPTVLVYGHYDVQPVDPLHEWTRPPFEPRVEDEKIWARGASDDKGQVILHVNALEAHLKATGTCPVNVKYLIEGEEEVGSDHLEPYVERHRERLACDCVVVSDTAFFARGVPSICYGLRGLAYFQIDVRGTDRDLHSGTFGGSVMNPAFALVQILSQLKDRKGRILVPGFYDKVRKLTREERRAFASLPHSDRRWARDIGAPDLFGVQGQEAPVAIVSMAASAPSDVSRGMGFLLDRHRLNVAVSRGKHSAFLVRSEVLTEFAPRTPDELIALGAFLGLCANAVTSEHVGAPVPVPV